MQQRNGEHICKQEQQISSASFFLMGLAVGSAAALLLSPLSGRHLRNLLGERVDEGRRVVKARARESWDKAAGFAEEVATKVESGKRHLAEEGRRMEAAIQAGKQAYQGSSPAQSDGVTL